MNVVFVNDNALIVGGASKIAILNARELADRGHNIYFFCAVPEIGPELKDHPGIHIVCTNQYELLTDPSRIRAFAQGWWNPKAERSAEILFARLKPEDTVVHLHTWAKALSSSVNKIAVKLGFSVVCTLHDFLLSCPTGTLFIHPQQEICTLEPMSLSCILCNCDTRSYGQKLWRVGRQAIQQRVGFLPSGVRNYIAYSSSVWEIMQPHLPADAIVHRLFSYIDSSKREPAEPAAHQRFLFMGRLVREKGVLMLARAANAERIDLVFVGDGALADEIKMLNSLATITGWVDHSQATEYLRNCRVLIFPSLWYETLGLVVLEAASHGIPSVVPDTGAASEIVIDGVTGLHFKAGNEDDLRIQMRRMQNPSFAKQLGRAAYDRFWTSDFSSKEKYFESLESVYRQMLRRRINLGFKEIGASEESHDIDRD